MTINYTTLLGLAKPVTGTESGAWGDVVNDQITSLLEDAIANAASISVTSGNVTLTDNNGSSDQARMAILLVTGTPGASRNIVAPSTSKWYIVKNGSNDVVVLKGSATTGVTIPSGAEALAFWNGSDFELAAMIGPSTSTDNAVARFDGTTGKIVQNSAVTIDDSNVLGGVTQLNVDNLRLDANTISSTDANGNIVLAPNGTGDVQIDADTLRVGDSGVDANIQSNGNADLILKTGNATTGSVTLADGSNGNLTIALNGTGQIIVNAGAVGTPTIAPTGDTNTGIFFPAADTIAFADGGVEAMRIDSSGNVGVGTSSPSGYRVRINAPDRGLYVTTAGASAALPASYLSDSTHGVDAVLSPVAGAVRFGSFTNHQLNLVTNNTIKATLDSSGNLGLGVTPSAWTNANAYQVGSYTAYAQRTAGTADLSMSWNATITSGAGSGTGYVYRFTGDLASAYEQNGAHRWYTAPSGTAGNAITFTQAMTLTNSGNLGIGTTSPGAKLQVAAGSSPSRGIAAIFVASTTGAQIQFTQGGVDDWAIGQPSGTSAFAFWSGRATGSDGTERARITSGGKFLIGTTSSRGTLTVDAVDAISTGDSNSYAITCGNHVPDALAFGSDASFAYIQSFSSPLIINSQGNEVRVGGTTDQGAYNLQCNGTGVWGAGAYVNGSDERLKDNIQTLNDGLSVVSQLRPVTFQYKPEHSKDQSVQPGFIAQELQQAMAGKDYLDGVVQSGPEYLNVAYQSLIPILTKAIQEAHGLIKTLEQRVAALEAK